MTTQDLTDDARSMERFDLEWPSAYSTWPVQSRPTWSLEEARHRGSVYIPADSTPLPAWIDEQAPVENRYDVAGTTDSPSREIARRVARVHTLTDPLGAKGFRRTRRRVQRETSARRRVFAVSIATFATCFGLILHSNTDGNVEIATAGETVSTVGNSAESLLTDDPTNTPTPTTTGTSTKVKVAVSVIKTATVEPESATGSAGATETPEATETARPTRTPEPTATATEEVVRQAPKSHTQSKSS